MKGLILPSPPHATSFRKAYEFRVMWSRRFFPGRSSRIRHRNASTEKAREDTVQGLGSGGSRGAPSPRPLVFRPNWGPKGRKKIFWGQPPHPLPAFIWRYGSTAARQARFVTLHCTVPGFRSPICFWILLIPKQFFLSWSWISPRLCFKWYLYNRLFTEDGSSWRVFFLPFYRVKFFPASHDVPDN